jgi:hypothetical protein
MPDPIDPSTLEAEELDRWYRRSPEDVERDRQAAADRTYDNFFGADQSSTEDRMSSGDGQPYLTADNPNDVLWIVNGAGGYRAIRPSVPDYETALKSPPLPNNGLPANPAMPESADLLDVGNPHNPRLRREWERANSQAWPTTTDGRNYHVAHTRAIADGGANTLDNIQPMHPDEHIAQHMANGDSARWARRASIARAFGGRVEPPTPGLRMNGLGWLNLLDGAARVLFGGVRTDTFRHSLYDLSGYPDPNDPVVDPNCRSIGFNEPGSTCA